MAQKRVKFNLPAEKCGLCVDSHPNVIGDADNDVIGSSQSRDAVVFCKTCGTFVCDTCQRVHRKLIVFEGHQIIHRDHMVNDVTLGMRDGTYTKHRSTLNQAVSSMIKMLDESENKRMSEIKRLKNYVQNATEEETVDEDIEILETKEVFQEEGEEEETPKYDFTETCPAHQEEFIKYFCEFHDQLCCDVCKIRDHSICETKMKFIPEKEDISNEVDRQIKNLKEQITNFKEYDSRLQGDMRELKKSKDNFLQDLNTKRDELLAWISQMEEKTLKRLESVFASCKAEIDRRRKNARQACERLRSEMYRLKQLANDTVEENISSFIKSKQASKTIASIKTLKESRKGTTSRFSMVLNRDVEKARMYADDLFGMKIAKKGDVKYNIRLKSDKNVPSITGCTMLHSGDIILADANNSSLKVFSQQLKHLTSFDVNEGVFDVTSLGENTVAVSCPDAGEIKIVDLKPEPTIVKSLNTGPGMCWGVQTREEMFVVNVTKDDDAFIRIIDWDSNIVFELQIKNCLYSTVSQIPKSKELAIYTVSCFTEGTETGEMPFVDEYRDQTQSGVVVRQFNYLKNLVTRGVTSDASGNAVVCCVDVDQVYTVSRDGDAVELLLAEVDGLDAPQALCYSKDKRTLLVTSAKSNFVQIFEFERN